MTEFMNTTVVANVHSVFHSLSCDNVPNIVYKTKCGKNNIRSYRCKTRKCSWHFSLSAPSAFCCHHLNSPLPVVASESASDVDEQ